MDDGYWSTLLEFGREFGRRAVYVLGVALLGVVDALDVFEPFVGFKITDRIPPGLFGGAVGLGLWWAMFETYRQKPASKESVEWDRDTYRAMRLRQWRQDVKDYDGSHIYKVPGWSEMRAHLDPELVQGLESGVSLRPRFTAGREYPSDKELVLDDLARIEKEWGLL